MVDEVTRAVLAIDSTSVVAASSALDEMAAAGGRVGSSSKGLETNLLRVNERTDDFTLSVRGLTKSQAEYFDTLRDRAITLERMAEKQKVLDAQNKKNADSTKKLSGAHSELSFTSGQVVREYAVLVNELQRGDFTRFQGSLITLANRTNLVQKAFSGAGVAISIMAVTAGLAVAAAAKLAGEHRELEKSLIRTNSASGLTADSALAMSRDFTTASTSIGATRSAIDKVVASGTIGVDRIGQTTRAALDNLVVTGAEVEKTITIIERLRDKPVEALTELNKQFNFLSVAAFESVRELELAGDTFGAGELSVKLFTDALAKMREETENTRGSFKRLTDLGSNSLSGAFATIGSFSILPEQQTLLERTGTVLSELLVKIDEIKSRSSDGSREGLGLFDRFRLDGAVSRLREVVELQKRLSAGLQPGRDAEAEASSRAQDAEDARQFAARIARLDAIDTRLVRQRRRERELAQEAKDTAEARKIAERTGVSDPTLSEEAQRQRIEAIELRFRNIDPRKSPKTDGERESDRLRREESAGLALVNKFLTEHNALLEEVEGNQSKLSATQSGAVKLLANISAGNLKVAESQQDGARIALNDLIVRDKLNESKKESVRLDELSADISDRLTNVSNRQVASLDEELRSIVQGTLQNEIAFRLDQIRVRTDQERLVLADKFGEVTSENNERYIEELSRINSAEEDLVARELEGFEQRQRALSDWRNGVKLGFEEFARLAGETSTSTRELTVGAFDGMADSVASFVTTGKLGFKSLTSSIVADLVRMEAKILLSSILRGILGSFGGQGSGFSGGVGSGGFDASGFAASGGVFSSGMRVQQFARGGIIDKPTFLGMAGNKLLQAGEDGKEAILPVKQDSRGRLGVISVGEGSGEGGTIQLTVQVFQGKGDGVTSEVSQKQDGRALVKLILGEVSSSIASNGSVARTLTDTFGLKRSARR